MRDYTDYMRQKQIRPICGTCWPYLIRCFRRGLCDYCGKRIEAVVGGRAADDCGFVISYRAGQNRPSSAMRVNHSHESNFCKLSKTKRPHPTLISKTTLLARADGLLFCVSAVDLIATAERLLIAPIWRHSLLH